MSRSNLANDGRPHPRARGFTLVEVLIAVVIMSIGLLGLAALQGQSMRFNHSAYLRSQATNFAYDMSDRMRANWVAANAGAYDIDIGDSGPVSAVDVAGADLQEWKTALAVTLPAGDGAIARDGNGHVTITIQWDDSRGEEDVAQFSMMTRL